MHTDFETWQMHFAYIIALITLCLTKIFAWLLCNTYRRILRYFNHTVAHITDAVSQ